MPLEQKRQSSRRTSAGTCADKELAGELAGLIVPQRHSLAGQVVEIIQAGIRKNIWRAWLPPERCLAKTLQVSRSTLRAALAQLEKSGVIRVHQSFGTSILAAPKTTRSQKTRCVALLTSEPISMGHPYIARTMDELRGLLAEQGYRLRTFYSSHYFKTASCKRLKQLVDEHPHDCWVLTMVSDSVRKWFHAQKIPCVVSGTCAPGIHLPFVDLDYYAICHHAVGQMTGLGHKRIVFLTAKPDKAGYLASERGFKDGIAAASDPLVSGRVLYPGNTQRGIAKTFEQLFADTECPTAMLITNSLFFIRMHTYLHSVGMKIPADISLVCRDDDSFMDHITPSPTRYLYESAVIARHLFKFIMKTIEGAPVLKQSKFIIPDYHRGATLAAPPK